MGSLPSLLFCVEHVEKFLVQGKNPGESVRPKVPVDRFRKISLDGRSLVIQSE